MSLKLHSQVLQIRELEQKIADKYSSGLIRCPVHLSIGQEAAAVGVISCLSKNDHLYSTHRSHAHYLAKGGNIKAMIAELYGKSNGCVGGVGGSMHLQDISVNFHGSIPIVGSSIGLAAGCAYHNKKYRDKQITVVYVGDASLEEGIFYEICNFASLHNLKLLFVCENNLFSVYTDIKKRQVTTNFTKYADAFNINSLRIDGNNVLNIHNKTKKILDFIKRNNKPFFLQLDTFRYYEHCGPNIDDHLNYRKKSLINKWKNKDPVILAEKYIKKNYGSNKLFVIRNKINNDLEKIFKSVIKTKLPNFKEASKHVFS